MFEKDIRLLLNKKIDIIYNNLKYNLPIDTYSIGIGINNTLYNFELNADLYSQLDIFLKNLGSTVQFNKLKLIEFSSSKSSTLSKYSNLLKILNSAAKVSLCICIDDYIYTLDCSHCAKNYFTIFLNEMIEEEQQLNKQ